MWCMAQSRSKEMLWYILKTRTESFDDNATDLLQEFSCGLSNKKDCLLPMFAYSLGGKSIDTQAKLKAIFGIFAAGRAWESSQWDWICCRQKMYPHIITDTDEELYLKQKKDVFVEIGDIPEFSVKFCCTLFRFLRGYTAYCYLFL